MSDREDDKHCDTCTCDVPERCEETKTISVDSGEYQIQCVDDKDHESDTHYDANGIHWEGNTDEGSPTEQFYDEEEE